MNPRVLLRSPGFLPERQLLKSSTQSLTSHLGRPPSLNFQKSFLFVASSSGNSGRRAFSSPAAGRFMDGGGGVAGGGVSGGECRKGGEAEGVGEGGEKGWSCGEERGEGGNEGDGRGSGEYKDGGVSSDSSGKGSQGSREVGTSVPWHHEGIDRSPAKRPPEPSVPAKGKLLPTPSRLLKLLLPLKLAGTDSPLVLLVHPQQPLSYLERLIQAELPPITSPNSTPNSTLNSTLRALNISFETPGEGGYVRWPTSTEIGDFIRNVPRGEEFIIGVQGRDGVSIGMPTFKEWTYYLRQRLIAAMREMELQAILKSECDMIARRGAQRVVSGFFGLMGCLAAVYWLTSKASLGWAAMEPVTYLVGLSTVMSGYLLLLYVLSKRQKRLYREKGFDIDKWEELVYESKALRRKIKAIAEEYDVGWDERSDEAAGIGLSGY